jgi:hypothetical protein
MAAFSSSLPKVASLLCHGDRLVCDRGLADVFEKEDDLPHHAEQRQDDDPCRAVVLRESCVVHGIDDIGHPTHDIDDDRHQQTQQHELQIAAWHPAPKNSIQFTRFIDIAEEQVFDQNDQKQLQNPRDRKQKLLSCSHVVLGYVNIRTANVLGIR